MKITINKTRSRVIPALIVLAGVSLLATFSLCARNHPEVAAEKPDQPAFKVPLDPTPVDRSNPGQVNSYAGILKKATPAVVAVHTAKVVKFVRGGNLDPREELLRRFFGLPAPRRRGFSEKDVEEKRIPQGIGSGVVVASDGYILTNNHVVMDDEGQEADEVLVQLNDGRELPAEIVGRDPRTDIAVLKIDAGDLPAIKMADSDNLEVGDVVFAIGNPMGIGLTVTQGIVSATGRAIGIYGQGGYENFIQTDASINPGNSGGALIDSEGRLVGINSAILSRTGGSIGIGFAIPSDLAHNIMTNLVTFGEVHRGYLGISIGNLDADMAEAFSLPNTDGVLVQKVEENQPAEKAGIKRGDVIVSLDGKSVKNANSLRLRVGQTLPGREIKVSLIRDGKPMEVTAIVADMDKAGSLAGGKIGKIFEGIVVSPLNDEMRQNYDIPGAVEGLVVTEVKSDSPVARYFQEGMVIIEINDQPVRDAKSAQDLLRTGINKLYIYNRGQTGYLAFRIQ